MMKAKQLNETTLTYFRAMKSARITSDVANKGTSSKSNTTKKYFLKLLRSSVQQFSMPMVTKLGTVVVDV